MIILGRHISFEIGGRSKLHKSNFMIIRVRSNNKERIAKTAWVITCKYDQRVVCEFDVTTLQATWAIWIHLITKKGAQGLAFKQPKAL